MNRLGIAAAAVGLLMVLALIASACAADDSQQSPPAQPTEQQQAVEQPIQPQSASAPQAQQQDEPATRQPQQASQPQANEPAQPAPETQPQSQPQQQQDEQVMTAEIRLITLFGDLTEIVYALGAEQYLVGRDASSIYPTQAEELPNLGFAASLNAEAILDLQPTLVIGTPMAGPPEVLQQLTQAGVEVLIVDDLNSLNAPQVKIRAVGEALGMTEQAEALAQDVEARMAAVIAASAEVERPLRVMLIYIRRGGLQLVSGAGNKSQAIIEAAGAIDAASEVGIEGWQLLTPEALVSADPDVYLVMDRGLEVIGGLDALLEIPGVALTRAGAGPYVISMADLYLLGFGPRLPEAIADLVGFLRDVRDEIDSRERGDGDE